MTDAAEKCRPCTPLPPVPPPRFQTPSVGAEDNIDDLICASVQRIKRYRLSFPSVEETSRAFGRVVHDSAC